MSAIIGTIKAVMGQVWIVASNGTRRLATEGEQVMRGEVVVTDQGAVTVTLPSGKNMDLGRGSEWGSEATSASASADVDPQAIAAAQQAIAEGADPTQILEATAAGNSTIIDSSSAPTGDHNGHTHVILDLTGEILDPTAGYPTEGLDTATIAPVEDITLIKPDVASNSDEPVTPPEPHPLPEASITIDVIAGDNVINMREATQEKTEISGTTGLDVRPGDTVTVTVNGNEYQTKVGIDGRWSVEVNTSDLVATGDVHASVTTYDQYGNQATANAESSVSMATTLPEVTITIDDVTGDGVINLEESQQAETELTGRVTGEDVVRWDEVQITIGDQTFTATVQDDLSWSVKVPTELLQDGTQIEVSVNGYDAADNRGYDTDDTGVARDLAVDVTIVIDPITGDDYLDTSETTHWQGQDAPTTTITGYVTGEATENDTVSITVNNTTYDNVPLKQVGDKLVWELTVDTAELVATPKVDAHITITDAAGNTDFSDYSRTVEVETASEKLGTAGSDTISANEGSSTVIIGDVEGFQAQPGQDYNIAFLVDTSGSVSTDDIKALVASLNTVFTTLAAGTAVENSGTLNILLVDFDANVRFSYEATFTSSMTDAERSKELADLISQMSKMKSDGSTNYGAAFENAAEWFSGFEGDGSTNLTYFITDGKPTIYTGSLTVVDVDARSTATAYLDINAINFKLGTAYSMRINGTSREVVDKNGNVYEWNGSTKTKIGTVVSDGAGGYKITGTFGSGTAASADNPNVTNGALSSFAMLLAVCGTIEALGVNSAIGANDLKAYDSDGNVQTDIKASELADAILGKNDIRVAGAEDIVQGKSGNDILFGDAVEFAGIAGNGFAAIREFISKEMGVDVSSITSAHIHQYITDHPEVFDMSRSDGGDDILFGGAGNDILYGGGGDDILAGGDGNDLIYGGQGNDILFGDGYNEFSELFNYISTKLGVESPTLADVQKYIIDNSQEFDISSPEGGDDTLYGGVGNDILFGGGGNDLLYGGEGNDTLYGGTGNDILIGGKGDDTLYGGSGSDTFKWLKGDDGHDVIKDFRADEGDRIDLSDLLGDVAETDLASYIRITDDSNGNAVIEINTNGQINTGATMSITVENCSAGDFDINSLMAKPDAPVI
ncbi:retention module-containing protein [Kluyvera sp. CHPC 1.2972]|uniref:retention module-containing protein n=1 Tax=Kluyvera sp. CHPC 1.2972 TaxID=2995176 RepID=UPI002FD86483